MHTSPVIWQALTVQYPFQQTKKTVQFFDFQIKAKQAFDQFIHSDFGSALVVKSEMFPEFVEQISGYFHLHSNVVIAMECNSANLFGYTTYLEQGNQIKTVQGLLAQANEGILIVNLRSLLLDIHQWDKLKQALLFGQYEQIKLNAVPDKLPLIESKFKLLLIGSREDISALYQYDESIYQFCHYTEIESYLSLDGNNLQQWGDYIQCLAECYTQKSFSTNGLNQFYQNCIRESENQKIITISPTLLKKYLVGIQHFYANHTLFDDVQCYFDYLVEQSTALNQYVLQDMLNHQLYIETDGEVVGQINGLSVVEFDGMPYSFGEPLRISCNVQYGDGEISDIERKVELGGNIHSKGVIIAQSCLANLLELPTQLPFSASVAFEQSYGEIDGDSSSLAIFCVLMSALSQLPLPQTIAVTGAIDQFGNVLSVGGVNQKIEGFFTICNARQLTGKQGVIIPAVCLSQLSLNPQVLNAVRADKFKIWAVENVFDALEILLRHQFYDDESSVNSNQLSLFKLVHHHIEQNQQSEITSGSFWQKICKWLNKD